MEHKCVKEAEVAALKENVITLEIENEINEVVEPWL